MLHREIQNHSPSLVFCAKERVSGSQAISWAVNGNLKDVILEELIAGLKVGMDGWIEG